MKALYLIIYLISWKVCAGQVLTTDIESYCGDITEEGDKFTGEKKYYSPYSLPASITKVISKGSTDYYLSLTTTGSTVNVGIKGVTILLSNGSRISKPKEEIDVEANSSKTYGYGDYSYSAFIALTPADIALLSKQKITDFRLCIYDKSLYAEDQEKLQMYMRCLVRSK